MASAAVKLTAQDWAPFWVDNSQQLPPRKLGADFHAGVGDRLRAAAFAELQAERAFLWAAEHFSDAPPALKTAWVTLAGQERKHLGWLVARMQALQIDLCERPVADVLWLSLMQCTTARDFAHHMAGAEERGRRAGERFALKLRERDPESAAIFGKIAEEELAHIALAEKFYPKAGESCNSTECSP